MLKNKDVEKINESLVCAARKILSNVMSPFWKGYNGILKSLFGAKNTTLSHIRHHGWLKSWPQERTVSHSDFWLCTQYLYYIASPKWKSMPLFGNTNPSKPTDMHPKPKHSCPSETCTTERNVEDLSLKSYNTLDTLDTAHYKIHIKEHLARKIAALVCQCDNVCLN